MAFLSACVSRALRRACGWPAWCRVPASSSARPTIQCWCWPLTCRPLGPWSSSAACSASSASLSCSAGRTSPPAWRTKTPNQRSAWRPGWACCWPASWWSSPSAGLQTMSFKASTIPWFPRPRRWSWESASLWAGEPACCSFWLEVCYAASAGPSLADQGELPASPTATPPPIKHSSRAFKKGTGVWEKGWWGV